MNRKFIIEDAEREKLKARIGLTGATNCGKTYTSLIIAGGLLISEGEVDENGKPLWSKVAVIDTERKRSLFYAQNGVFGKFKHINFEPPYDPNDLKDLIKDLEKMDIKVVIIDSLTHFWNGTGGILDQVNKRTRASRTKNSYTDGWGGEGGGTETQNSMIDEILGCNMHTICTFRQKMDYTIEKNEEGRTVINKIGVKPVQRDDLEYEFDITLKLDNEHKAEIIKNTVTCFQSSGILEPLTFDFGIHLGEYLAQGKDPEEIKKEQQKTLSDSIISICKEDESCRIYVQHKYINTGLKLQEADVKILTQILKELNEMRK